MILNTHLQWTFSSEQYVYLNSYYVLYSILTYTIMYDGNNMDLLFTDFNCSINQI